MSRVAALTSAAAGSQADAHAMLMPKHAADQVDRGRRLLSVARSLLIE
jgi:hypothetical protein